MKFSKLSILFLLIVSCQKKEEKPAIQPLLNLPTETNVFEVRFNPINNKEKAQFQKKINHFYNSRINLDNFSGQFLVAKKRRNFI